MAETFQLNKLSLIPAAKDFINSNNSYCLEVGDTNDIITLSIKRKEETNSKNRGIVQCYMKDNGISFNICGKSLFHSICEDCKQYIIEHCKLPACKMVSSVFKNLSESDFQTSIELCEEEGYSVIKLTKIDDTKIYSRVLITWKYNMNIYATFYKTGTLLIQGTQSVLFIKVNTLLLSLHALSDEDEILDIFKIQECKNEIFDIDIKKQIPNMPDIAGSVIEKFILTSISLFNSGCEVEDYSAYTFGLFKALEWVIDEYVFASWTKEKKFGSIFAQQPDKSFVINNGVVDDSKVSFKTALSKAYTLYHDGRHSTFHANNFALETSRTLSFDEAVEMAKKIFESINAIYKFAI